MADYPSPPKSDAEYRAEAEMKLLGTEPLETYLRREFAKQPVQSEHEFLYGESPHPAVVDHTAAVVERVQALTPPSLVRMDRAETALAAVVARRKLEHQGQFGTDQWWGLKRYEDGLVDRYLEETS